MLMKAFGAGAALISVISVTGAQAPADFAGSWQASSGFPARVTITQTATELTLIEITGTRERKFTFKLDGSDSRNETVSVAGETWKYLSNARWISSGLLITTKTTRTTLGQSWDSMRILYRDGAGNLHIGTMDAVTDPGPFNAMAFTDTVYKKAAAEAAFGPARQKQPDDPAIALQ